ncbi:hypothetical protein PG991_009054 [Apiospora marii]|uniref:Uncharacterized protein n=1 Tax=Apiospora marii TaxID=335849 RepID=A0ABR1RKV0_9PEZI
MKKTVWSISSLTRNVTARLRRLVSTPIKPTTHALVAVEPVGSSTAPQLSQSSCTPYSAAAHFLRYGQPDVDEPLFPASFGAKIAKCETGHAEYRIVGDPRLHLQVQAPPRRGLDPGGRRGLPSRQRAQVRDAREQPPRHLRRRSYAGLYGAAVAAVLAAGRGDKLEPQLGPCEFLSPIAFKTILIRAAKNWGSRRPHSSTD